ncbi:AraC family transcriptional regulator [Pseudonocardia kujensis]|uniref:AraC family transcriptional regulator n=1 Tax=Pseudonocardia kujensis TaxID=1128675 RepID=UPI001E5131B2|nr:AraC family transcriptional regulator [Pseudonocardia kujensis]MCE0768217.1 AraC family transcriptional regulator [Pseudonocardia kujensis]
MRSGTTEPLARFTVLRTDDPDAAERIVSRAYVPHRLRASGRLDARLNLTSSPRLAFGYLTYGGEAELVVPPMVDCYHLNLTVEGRTLVRQGGARVLTCAGAGGVLLSPQRESTLEWSADARQFAVKIPVVSLQAQLSSLLHEPVAPPQFGLRVDLASDIGRGLLGAASFLAGQFDTGEVAELVRDQLESYLLTQVLMATEHADSARLRGGGATGRLSLEEAVDYIEAYPERTLGIAELAAVAGAPATALQAAFEADLGMTAEQYVREVRLTRAHAELGQGRPGDSVGSIARRWGFGSARRFRVVYRARYGHNPGVTRTRMAPRG